MRKTKAALVAATTICVLAGCGGGGGSDPTPNSAGGGTGGGNAGGGGGSSSKQTVTGVVATGAAMQNAVVTLHDAVQKNVNCPANTSTGAFSCDVTGATAPFALSATGNVADTQLTLMSATASPGSQTVNITSLTNAIMASLVGDDPRKLMSDPALLQSKITSSAMTSAIHAYSAALTDVMSATGNSGANLISSPLTVGAPGMDQLLDQLKINVQPDGSVQLSSVAGASQDTPAMLKLAPGTVPAANDKSSLPSTLTINGQPISSLPTPQDLAALQASFTQCFASPSTGNSRFQGQVAACKNLIIDDVPSGQKLPGVPAKYLSNGLNAEMDLGSPMIADNGMNGAIFSQPEIIRVQASDKLWIKLNWTRSDGMLDGMQSIVQIAAPATASDKGWRLVGNQRHILSKVLGVAQRWDWLNPSKSSNGVNAFISTLAIQVGAWDDQGTQSDFAIVTGPGLRNGLLLKPSAGDCDTLNIHAQLAPGEDANVVPSKYPGRLNSCRTSYRMAGVAQNPNEQAQFKWPTSNTAYSNPPLSNSEFSTVTPLSVYTFKIYQNGVRSTPAYTYEVRVRSTPPLPDVLRRYSWQTINQETQARLIPTSNTAFTGGALFPVGWTSAANIPFVKKSTVQIRSTLGGQPSKFVSGFLPIKPVLPGTVMKANIPASFVASFPAIAGASGSSDLSFANLSWSDTFDLTYSTNVEYDH